MKKIYCVICGKYRKLKNLKYQTFSKKQFLLLFAISVNMNGKKTFKKINGDIKNSWFI